MPWTFSLPTISGCSSRIGVSFTTEVGAGEPSPVQAKVSFTVNGEVTYDLNQALGNSLEVTVPSRHYGWVAPSKLATTVTGEWTFDVNGYPWTAEDSVTVPLMSDDQGRTSVYLAQMAPEFTSCRG